MPDKTGRLNRQERTFVEVYAGTNDATYAAAKAGYSSPQPSGSSELVQARDHGRDPKGAASPAAQRARAGSPSITSPTYSRTRTLRFGNARWFRKVVLEHWKTVVDDGLQKDPRRHGRQRAGACPGNSFSQSWPRDRSRSSIMSRSTRRRTKRPNLLPVYSTESGVVCEMRQRIVKSDD